MTLDPVGARIMRSAAGRKLRLLLSWAFVTVALVVVALSLRLAGPPRATPAAGDEAQALVLALDTALQRPVEAQRGVAIRPLAPDQPSDDAAAAHAVCADVGEALVRLTALRVVTCRSTALAVAAALDDRSLARLLSVRYLLTGSVVVRPDDRVQVRLALVDTGSGARVWQLDDDLALGELQAVSAQVAEAVARTLGVAATGSGDQPIAAPAYARYLKAQMLARQPSIEGRRAAVRLLDEVVAAEPDYVPALLLRHSLRGWLLGNLEEARDLAAMNAARAENVAEGLVLARRILAQNPDDLRGQWLLLADEIERGAWAAGFERLDTMLGSASYDARLLRTAAQLHLHAGYLARAEALALSAARIDALDAAVFEVLAHVAGMHARDAQMREFAAIARQLGHEGMGRVEMMDAFRQRDWALLERTYAGWVGWGGKWSADWVPQWVRGVADPAQRDAAIALLDGHDAATRQHFVSYFIEYALLGDFGRSLAAVRHHARMPPATWMQGLWWPELAPVRGDAQFVDAMADLGFVALWEARGAPDLCERSAAGRWQCH
ncbi:MAG: hypothetical protein ACK4V1_02435 [Burkholderiaceae bacterium]